MRSDKTGAAATAGAKGKTMKVRLVTRARLATSALGLVAIAAVPMLSSPLLAARAHRHAAAHAVTHAKLPQRHVGSGEPAGMRVMPGISAPARSLALGIGHGQLVTLPSAMSDVFVANDAIADVQVKTGNQLYVFGKSGGETTVYASNARGEVVWSANVRVGQNLDSIEQMLHMAMPDAHITSSTMNNTVLLTGTVAAPEDAAEAERLVKAFVADKTTVISRLKMATPLQVNLSVKIAEVSRSLTRNISSNLTSVSTANGFKYGIGQGTGFFQSGSSASLGVGNVPSTFTYDPTAVTALNPTGQVLTKGVSVNSPLVGTALAGMGHLFGMDLLGALDLGEQIGLVTTLAEPNLTALSGETADFLAGGEYPIPVNTGLGATSIEFKKYGVSLSYTPTVLANGRISLRVRPEVSELTSEGSVTINGLSVPGLTVRRAETTVELGSGQSFMIAGLLKNNSQDSISKLPGAGDIPVLGSLFRSTAFKKGETELVIVVTPYLVNPVDANQIHLPTDGFKSADALQQLLGNVESDNVKGEKSPKPTEKPATQQSAMPAGQQGARPAIGPVGDASGTTADRPRKRTKQASADTQPGFSIQ
ncbi:type II and III secretion system protein family protein [Novosphingobium sp.]|uniref:type II and III secretion system protein family protein n=1 Tax=Novosphingobium sp. TaxID=1874826 RepID=UPI00333F38A6